MDRVRFGRVLGRGTRLAARTVYEAIDAATADAPAAPRTGPAQTARRSSEGEVLLPGTPRPRSHQRTRPAVRPSGAQSKRTGIFAPVKRASKAVSLEITGSFFALFAFAFAVGAWRSRATLSTGGPAFYRFLLYCAVTLVFGYFACSNFVRAKRLTHP